MNANAPEKLYVENRKILYSCLTAYTNKRYDDDIEYTRTDAFIEKAVSYIQQHWIWNTKIIEDFKKYMKGEKV